MLLKLRVDFIAGVFLDQACQSILVYLCVIELIDVVVLGVAQLHNGVFESNGTLLVGVGNGGSVAAVHLGVDQVFLNVNVLFYVLDGLLLVLLCELVRLDQCALKRIVGVGIFGKRLGCGDLTAARLILEELFLGAAVDDLVALTLGKRGVW